MRLATQREIKRLEKLRDKLAEKICPYDIYHSGGIEAIGFKKGFDKGAEEMAKLKDEEWEKRVAGLVTALSIYALTNESFPEYNDLALKALENFRKEVKNE